jgi:hypothetical protein
LRNELIISLFPNPTTGNFTLSSEIAKGEIIIYNVQGERIYFSSINSTKSEIDLSKQPNGIYFLQLKTEWGVATKKLVINK